jgi:hypothetical protein
MVADNKRLAGLSFSGSQSPSVKHGKLKRMEMSFVPSSDASSPFLRTSSKTFLLSSAS